MKKMQTLFKKSPYHLGRITNEMRTDVKNWISESTAYIKRDGTSVLVSAGVVHTRFDYKEGRTLPLGAIPCQEEADKDSGHFPHWIPVTELNKTLGINKELLEVFENSSYTNGTYEFCGTKIQGNPENINGYKLIKHDSEPIIIDNYTYDGLLKTLIDLGQEGIVFHHKNSDLKVKHRLSDYGINWKVETEYGRYMSFIEPQYYNQEWNSYVNSKKLVGSSIKFYLNIEDYLNLSKWLVNMKLPFEINITSEGINFKAITRNKKRKLILLDFNNNIIPFKSINSNKLSIELTSTDNKVLNFINEIIYHNEGI